MFQTIKYKGQFIHISTYPISEHYLIQFDTYETMSVCSLKSAKTQITKFLKKRLNDTKVSVK